MPFPGKRPRTPENPLRLLADIRACALDALTVAGAAQVALGATALAVPVSRLTRAPRGTSGTEQARQL
jgi:hypothetical protein